jgi:hypothetical protein
MVHCGYTARGPLVDVIDRVLVFLACFAVPLMTFPRTILCSIFFGHFYDRKTANKVSPSWSNYHRLQMVVATMLPAPLCVHRAPPGQPTHLPTKQSVLYVCALLRFPFYSGDFVRWLGGKYTNRHRDWETTFRTLQDICLWPPPIDLPPADFPWGFRICT